MITIKKQKITIFASGEGTNANVLFKYFSNHPKIIINLLICNNSGANVIRKAEAAGIPFEIINKKDIEQDKLTETLARYNTDWIVLAGFMLKIPLNVINRFRKKIINIHPSLLPAYGGKGMYGNHVHKAVLENLEIETGISIHLVDEEYDTGRILFQKKIKIEKDETVDSLSSKVKSAEHLYYPEIVENHILKNS
ncbi:MAG: phosphoribosylglycinamide formyltransferase [Chitinophagaceae bacterium]|nr:MAG: phosphoribosylglycinamide formyltransferase [Chitinophagaceae bacterium]